MVAKRIIPCLDVRDGKVVKGVAFQNHQIIGDILELADFYSQEGADELVFYDITASTSNRNVCPIWVKKVAAKLHIPFTVAGGIRDVGTAEAILHAGADKISINSPALERPELINELSQAFGRQCVVVGVDSLWIDEDYHVYQYTGDTSKSRNSQRKTQDWVQEAQDRGAGEIVLNCMRTDGLGQGYDIKQLQTLSPFIQVPLVASGGAGELEDFVKVFQKVGVSAALAASVFHKKYLTIAQVKQYLLTNHIEVRL